MAQHNGGGHDSSVFYFFFVTLLLCVKLWVQARDRGGVYFSVTPLSTLQANTLLEIWRQFREETESVISRKLWNLSLGY